MHEVPRSHSDKEPVSDVTAAQCECGVGLFDDERDGRRQTGLEPHGRTIDSPIAPEHHLTGRP